MRVLVSFKNLVMLCEYVLVLIPGVGQEAASQPATVVCLQHEQGHDLGQLPIV